MIKKHSNLKRIIIPNKKVFIFSIIIVLIGITSGAIFSTIINQNDKNLVIDKISLFISNVNSNSLNLVESLKNSILINLIYLTLIWIFGLTIIGVIANISLLFIKNFIIGFSLSSFIITYNAKGLLISSLYLIFSQFINICILIIITSYSIISTFKLINTITTNNIKFNSSFLKNYFIIYIILIIISIISSISETFLFPSIIKLFIKLFI